MKKIKKWLYWNALDILLITLLFFTIILACLIGYTVGEQDGYAEGYIHASTNNYKQSPGGSVLENAQEWGQSLKRMIPLYINEQKQTAQTSADSDFPTINVQYLEETAYIQEKLESCLQNIPSDILIQFADEGWTLEICKELSLLTYKNSEFNAAGLTKNAEKKIIIEANSGDLNNIVSHEFGHYVDFLYERPSKTNEWKELYLEEWRGVYKLTHNFHNVDAPVEFFASVFSLYIRRPVALQTLCPKSFAAMEQILSHLE